MPGMTIAIESERAIAEAASMRPRLNAGDDVGGQWARLPMHMASMRPRLNAGDDMSDRVTTSCSQPSLQ